MTEAEELQGKIEAHFKRYPFTKGGLLNRCLGLLQSHAVIDIDTIEPIETFLRVGIYHDDDKLTLAQKFLSAELTRLTNKEDSNAKAD